MTASFEQFENIVKYTVDKFCSGCPESSIWGLEDPVYESPLVYFIPDRNSEICMKCEYGRIYHRLISNIRLAAEGDL